MALTPPSAVCFSAEAITLPVPASAVLRRSKLLLDPAGVGIGAGVVNDIPEELLFCLHPGTIPGAGFAAELDDPEFQFFPVIVYRTARAECAAVPEPAVCK